MISTRTYTLSSTQSISDLIGSSTGMPDGMTSSISSDGTTFILTGDDSQLSSAATGVITMTANGNDAFGNERVANASVPGEILPYICSVSYDINDIYAHLSELEGAYLISIVFSNDFEPTNFGQTIDYNFSLNNSAETMQFNIDGNAKEQNYYFFTYEGSLQTYTIFSMKQGGGEIGNNDFTTDLMIGTENTRTLAPKNLQSPPTVSFSEGGDNVTLQKNGTIIFTFAINQNNSSFALNMN